MSRVCKDDLDRCCAPQCVGMSQWGAHGLAEQGADFRTILQHYYRGAEVVPFRTHHDPSMAQQPQIKPLWRG